MGEGGTGSYPCVKPALTFAHVADDPERVLLFKAPWSPSCLGGGGEALRPPYYSPQCVHTHHTYLPALSALAGGSVPLAHGDGSRAVNTLPVGVGWRAHRSPKHYTGSCSWSAISKNHCRSAQKRPSFNLFFLNRELFPINYITFREQKCLAGR